MDRQEDKNYMFVEVRNGNIERAMRVLKRKLTDENVFKDLQKHRFYEKPSEKRRRKKRAAVARQRREDAERIN